MQRATWLGRIWDRARAVSREVKLIVEGVYLCKFNNKCIKWERLKEGSQQLLRTGIHPQLATVQHSRTLSWLAGTSYFPLHNQYWHWNQWREVVSRYRPTQIALHLRHSITVIISKRLTTLISISSSNSRTAPTSSIPCTRIMASTVLNSIILMQVQVSLPRSTRVRFFKIFLLR